MTEISIPKGKISLSALLFKPQTTSTQTANPALIIVHPGGGVKEQTASLYARHLSLPPHNFITICYDASHQGASGGEPHFLEDPSARVSDVSAVADYLITSVPGVDVEKIGVLGICAGGGYAVAAATRDYRLKAVATVSMVNIGASFRLGWDGKDPASNHVGTLKMAADARVAELKTANSGEEGKYAPYVPTKCDDSTPFDLKEAADYYLTPRAQHPRAENKMLISSFPLILTFDAFEFADVYLTQPVCCVVGGNAGSKWHTDQLDAILKKGKSGSKGVEKLVVVEGGTHMDFYDREEFVGRAVQEVGGFLKDKLVSL
ncbi:hypothetical protein TWF281_011377 [Arthrobotrys megalospora]